MKFTLNLRKNLEELISELIVGLTRLDFLHNFNSFEIEVFIAAGEEVVLKNQGSGAIPKRMLITKQIGNGLVTAGPTAWTNERLYVKNHGASSVNVKIIFFK